MNSIRYRKWIFAAASVLLAFVLPLADPAFAGQSDFDFPINNEMLETGHPQLFQRKFPNAGSSKKRQIAAAVLIDATPEEVWEVLKNWDDIGDYAPDVEYYRTVLVLAPNGKGRIGKSFIEGKLDIPLFDIRYTLDVTFNEPGRTQVWRLLTPEEVEIYELLGIQVQRSSSGIESLEGRATIRPHGDGSKAVFTYSTTVEYSMPLPEFIEDYIAETALNGYMDGIKNRVESQGLYVNKPFSLFQQ